MCLRFYTENKKVKRDVVEVGTGGSDPITCNLIVNGTLDSMLWWNRISATKIINVGPSSLSWSKVLHNSIFPL